MMLFCLILLALVVTDALAAKILPPEPSSVSIKQTKHGYGLIETASLEQLLATEAQEVVVVDARNPEEYQEVHIKGAINIPLKKFKKYADFLPKNTSTRIIFYCNGIKCGKSKKAAKQALKLGYSQVIVYAEGMPVWEEKGLPIYAGPEYAKRIETDQLSPKELHAWIQSKADKFTVVDVRDPAEYQEGHIPGAINIPSPIFASRSGVLDKKKKIIVYCNGGGRSYNAYRKLMKLSYKDIHQVLFFDWQEAGLPVEKSDS